MILGDNLTLRLALSTGLAIIISIAALTIVSSPRSQTALAVALLSPDIVFTVSQTTALSYYGFRVRNEVTAGFLLVGRLLFLGGVLAATSLRGGLYGIIGAYLFADLITTIFSLGLAHKAIQLDVRVRLRSWWKVLRSGAGLGLMQIVNVLYFYLDTLLVSVLRSTSSAGVYGLSFSVVGLVGSFGNMFASALVPGLAVATRETATKTVQKALYVVVSAGIPLALGGILLRHQAVAMLGGPKFASAAVPFAILCASLPFTFATSILSYAAVALDNYSWRVAVSVGTLVLNVVINLLAIPRWGTPAAAVAVLVCEATSALLVGWFFRGAVGKVYRIRSFWRPLTAGACMALGYIVLSRFFTPSPTVGFVALASVWLAVVYLGSLILVRGVPPEVTEFLTHARLKVRQAR